MQEQLSQEEQISKLKKKKGRIEKGLEIAEKFVQNKTEELEQIEQELSDDSVLEEDTEEKEDLPLKKDEEDDDEEGEDPAHPTKKLRRYKKWIKRGLNYVLFFINKNEKELSDLEKEIDDLEQGLVSPWDPEQKKPKYISQSEMLGVPKLDMPAMDATFKGTARRGAMSKKEKDELVEEAKKKQKEERSNSSGQPVNKPNRPLRPGEKPIQPDFNKMTPDQKKDFINKKLKNKDPREQKQGLEILKKPENKEFLQEMMKDKDFQKTFQNAEKMVGKYDKIRDSMRKNLKSLMRSSSDVVKLQISRLRSGKVGSAVSGLKEIAGSVRFDNEVGKAAGSVVKGVEEMYKLFGIKPEESLNKQILDEAKPIFTHQMAEKGKNDREVDLKSKQNKVWGETKEITDQEKAVVQEISTKQGAENLPKVEKKEDVKKVVDTAHEATTSEEKKIEDAKKEQDYIEFVKKQKREAEKSALLKQAMKNER